MKTFRYWGTIVGVAVSLVLAALGFLTKLLLEMEKDAARAQYETAVQDELRMSMWHLDSVGLELLLESDQWLLKKGDDELRRDRQEAFSDSAQKISETFLKNAQNFESQSLPKKELSKAVEKLKRKKQTWAKPVVLNESAATLELSDEEIVQKTLRANALRTQADSYETFGNRAETIGNQNEILDKSLVLPSLAWVDGQLCVSHQGVGDLDSDIQIIDFERLKRHLLSQVVITHPGSLTLVRAGEESLADPLAMVTWPLRLTFEADIPIMKLGLTPLRGALATAWLAVLVALAAVFFLLRGLWRLSERRAAFVSSVTHELRTPLTTFQLYVEMLLEGMVPEEKRRKYLKTVHSESSRLSRLVENVLSYAKIERGSAKNHRSEVSVNSLVESILPHLTARAEQVGASVKVDFNNDTGEQKLLTDVTGVEQIIFNLVDNACKYAVPYAECTEIRLSASYDERQIYFKVCDKGPGISLNEQKRLFQAFQRSAKDAAESGAPGVGLGLALSRRLADELGGSLKLVDTKNQKGATFCLLLPR